MLKSIFAISFAATVVIAATSPGCKQPGQQLCLNSDTGPQCVQTLTNPNHCGNCKTRCSANETCKNGSCTPNIPACEANNACLAGNYNTCTVAGCSCVRNVYGAVECGTYTCHVDNTDCYYDSDCVARLGNPSAKCGVDQTGFCCNQPGESYCYLPCGS